MSGIFGGSRSRSDSLSENVNRDLINRTFEAQAQQGTDAVNQVMRLLGGDRSGLQSFQDATGFDAMAEQGSRGVTGNAAARGLLRSGSTGRALQSFGQNLQNQSAGQFIQQLLGVGQMGTSAGQLMVGAGQRSQETKTSREKPGLGKLIGQGLAGAMKFSDRRLKKNVVKIGKTPEGLNLYSFYYINGTGPFVGVMAQEVAKLKPEALGPVVNGYMSVDYSKLEGVIEHV